MLINILMQGGFSQTEAESICVAIERARKDPDWDRLCRLPLTRKTQENDAETLELTEKFAQRVGMPVYTLQLAYLASELPTLQRAYAEKNWNEFFFYGVVRDLRSKATECLENADCLGTTSIRFHMPFYRFECYALGRLQYEDRLNPEKEDFHFGSVTVHPGEPIHKMHIPSGAPLSAEERMKSYRYAFDFFGCTKEKPLVVHCGSWLLNPAHLTMLPPQSNIHDFVRDFVLLRAEPKPQHGEAWRIFGKAAKLPIDQWPTNNTLQRAYVQLLLSGGHMQTGHGFLIFDGDKLLTRQTD